MKHQHKWQFRGITLGGNHHGMSHRMCRCGAELYQQATKAEIRKHDPQGETQERRPPPGAGICRCGVAIRQETVV